jgi:hypothetical protein
VTAHRLCAPLGVGRGHADQWINTIRGGQRNIGRIGWHFDNRFGLGTRRCRKVTERRRLKYFCRHGDAASLIVLVCAQFRECISEVNEINTLKTI